MKKVTKTLSAVSLFAVLAVSSLASAEFRNTGFECSGPSIITLPNGALASGAMKLELSQNGSVRFLDMGNIVGDGTWRKGLDGHSIKISITTVRNSIINAEFRRSDDRGTATNTLLTGTKTHVEDGTAKMVGLLNCNY